MLLCISSHWSICKNVLIYFVASNFCITLLAHFSLPIPLGHQDALFDKHIAEDTFSDQELQDTGRPIKSLVVRYFISSCLTLHIPYLSALSYCINCTLSVLFIESRLVFYIIQSRMSPALVFFFHKNILNDWYFSEFYYIL